MGHAKNSPSTFSRRRACAGSARLEAGLPDKDTEYSLRGTAAHAVLEACLTENEHVTDYRGQEVVVVTSEQKTTTVKMENEDIKAIQAAVDYVNLRRQQNNFDSQCFFEERVTPSLWLGREGDCDGTLDVGLIYTPGIVGKDAVDVIDYKHGAGVAVEAENNDQLLLYAIGLLQKLDWTDRDQSIPVKMTIVQPRAQHPAGPVRTWEIPAHEIFAKIPEIKAVLDATDDPSAPLVPGDHCRFCKANPCEAVTAAATAVFKPVEAAPSAGVDWADAEQQMGRPPELLDPAALAQILDHKPLILGWLKKVEETALELANKGTAIPGYKRVHARTQRKWGADDEAVIKKLTSLRDTRTDEGKGKFKKADVTKVKPLSITEVEKQIKPYVSQRQWASMAELILKPEGAPVLAPNTDGRPAILDAEQVFQPIDQTQTVAAERPPWEN